MNASESRGENPKRCCWSSSGLNGMFFFMLCIMLSLNIPQRSTARSHSAISLAPRRPRPFFLPVNRLRKISRRTERRSPTHLSDSECRSNRGTMPLTMTVARNLGFQNEQSRESGSWLTTGMKSSSPTSTRKSLRDLNPSKTRAARRYGIM